VSKDDIVTFLSDDPDYRFTGLPLRVEYVDGLKWELLRDATYHTKANEFSTVHVGFLFDWASIPRFLWWLFPPAGDGSNCYGIAALWHDHLYIKHTIGGREITRKEADGLFYEIMIYIKVNKAVALTMWSAVRSFGWRGWNRTK